MFFYLFSNLKAKNNGESEEYEEIFKNIVKYNFKIEKNELSEECKDLITSKISTLLNLMP